MILSAFKRCHFRQLLPLGVLWPHAERRHVRGDVIPCTERRPSSGVCFTLLCVQAKSDRKRGYGQIHDPLTDPLPRPRQKKAKKPRTSSLQTVVLSLCVV
jgi:hypothetical protein